MRIPGTFSPLRAMLPHVVVGFGAIALTASFFLVLPLMEVITAQPLADLSVTGIDTADLPPPPPAEPEQEPEEEPEPEEKPPELDEPIAPLDLAQLELALNPGPGSDWGDGPVQASLTVKVSPEAQEESLVSIADLDQRPRVVYQPGPVLDERLRKKVPASVHIVFVVDERGRVEQPLVQASSDPAFERPALTAVKQWQFEPGRRKGEPVRFRMRVPITFPAGS